MKGGDILNSREDISLQLTLANIDKIATISKHINTNTTIESLAKDTIDFYNHVYLNIKTHDTTSESVLK